MRATYTYWRLAQSEIFREAVLNPSSRKHLPGSDAVNEARRDMDAFLKSVERKAFVMARMSLRHDDDAHDAVQDSMIRLVKSYADRPREEWEPLFYRILRNRVVDLQRRRHVRRRFMAWLPLASNEADPVAEAPARLSDQPERRAQVDQTIASLERAVRGLPARQREAFLLRALSGLNVQQTSAAMRCSTGSVKTHYSRAVHSLRATLGSSWGEGDDE